MLGCFVYFDTFSEIQWHPFQTIIYMYICLNKMLFNFFLGARNGESKKVTQLNHSNREKRETFCRPANATHRHHIT